jgi:hypothetical protein
LVLCGSDRGAHGSAETLIAHYDLADQVTILNFVDSAELGAPRQQGWPAGMSRLDLRWFLPESSEVRPTGVPLIGVKRRGAADIIGK